MSHLHLYEHETCPVCTRTLPLQTPRWIGESEPCPVCRQPLVESRAVVMTAASEPELAAVA
jgi:hypothetical protein